MFSYCKNTFELEIFLNDMNGVVKTGKIRILCMKVCAYVYGDFQIIIVFHKN